MLMNYTPLWIKTDYSILSSLIKIDDLIFPRLKESLCYTDFGNQHNF